MSWDGVGRRHADRTVVLPDHPAHAGHVEDSLTGYTWRLVAKHPDAAAWVALRWHGPHLRWGSHPVVIADGAVERMRPVADPAVQGSA